MALICSFNSAIFIPVLPNVALFLLAESILLTASANSVTCEMAFFVSVVSIFNLKSVEAIPLMADFASFNFCIKAPTPSSAIALNEFTIFVLIASLVSPNFSIALSAVSNRPINSSLISNIQLSAITIIIYII